jgi:Tfp pilus assembly protein FimV
MTTNRTILSVCLSVLWASQAMAQTYIVQSGDSLWKIADKTKSQNVTVHQMIAAIHGSNSSVLGADIGNIKPGMELEIPTGEAAFNANSKYATQLLGGTKGQGFPSTRNIRIDSIQKKISQIENEIDDTIEAMKTSQESFDLMVLK